MRNKTWYGLFRNLGIGDPCTLSALQASPAIVTETLNCIDYNRQHDLGCCRNCCNDNTDPLFKNRLANETHVWRIAFDVAVSAAKE